MQTSEFMDSLRRSKYLPMIDGWVLREASRTFSGAGVILLNRPGFFFSVNVSPASLSTENFASTVLVELEKAGINPSSLSIEIIESEI
jgi:EAL domain-containing protein (putative c-di-GMP-specific phosphodiesterase class I)